MATEATRRHKRIFTVQAKLIAGFWVAILALTGVSTAKQSIDNSAARSSAAAASKRVEFWEIVGGSKAPHSTGVRDQFAISLRDKLEPAKVGNDLPEAITDFKAGATEFGGIQDELGFSPFNNTGLPCSVCGPLNPLMLNNLQLIKEGRLQTVIGSEPTSVSETGLHLTPFGVPNVVWFPVLYLGAGTAAAAYAVRRDAKRNDYLPVQLNWKQDGGSSADPYKRVSKVLSPAYFAFLTYRRKHGGGYEGILKEAGLLDDRRDLLSAMERCRELPPGESRRAQQDLQSLLEQIDTQAFNYAHVSRDFEEMEAQAVRAGIDETVSRIGERLQALKLGREELEGSTTVMQEIEAAAAREHEHPDELHERRERRRRSS